MQANHQGSVLSIVSICAMLAEEMLIADGVGCGLNFGIDQLGLEGHLGDLFENDCVVDGVGGILAPGEGTMVAAEHAGGMHGVDAQFFEGFDDDQAGVLLIFAADFPLVRLRAQGMGP